MIFKQHQFGSWAAVSVLLGVLVDVSGGMTSIQLIPQNPVIGGSVTMSVTGITERIQNFVWYKGRNTNGEYQILAYIPGDNPIIPGPLNNSRMTPFPNGSLQISNLNMTDEGSYIVKIQTTINQSDTPVYLKIYDGPENVKVKAQRSPSNSFISFECSADSVPPATYHWRLNGTDIKNQQSSLQIDQKKAGSEGTYTCVANNSVTQFTAMDSIYVNVTTELIDNIDQPSSEGPITGIGIVIAVVLLLVLVAVLAYLFAKHRQHKKQPDSTNNALSSPEGPVYENVNAPQSHTSETALSGTPVQATQESHYEQLTHKDRAIYSTLSSKAGKH